MTFREAFQLHNFDLLQDNKWTQTQEKGRTMDPLALIGTVIAICQFTDRIISLASKCCRYRRASAEVQALTTELERLRLIFGALSESHIANQSVGLHRIALERAIGDCWVILQRTETALAGCLGEHWRWRADSVQTSPLGGWARLQWVRKKHRINELRGDLRIVAADLNLVMTLYQP